MTEPDDGAVLFQDPPRDPFRQHHRQLERGTGHGHRQLGDREAGSQDRGGPQRLQGVLGQETETAQDRQPQRRRQGHLRYLGPPAGGLDRALLGQRPQQLGDEQRVPGRSRYPGQQPGSRHGGHRLGHQLRHRPLGQAPHGENAPPGIQQQTGEAIQFRDARGGTQAPDEGHREIGQTAAHRGQRQQAGRVGPLQVIHADHQRPGQRELLRQVSERIDRAEPQPRVAGHRDRAPVTAPGGQQRGDGRPPRVRRRADAPERGGHQAERPGPLQLLSPARRHLHAAAARVLQHAGE